MLKAIVVVPPTGKEWTMNDVWHIANAEIQKYLHTHKRVGVKDLLWSDKTGTYIAIFEVPDGYGVQGPGVRAKGKERKGKVKTSQDFDTERPKYKNPTVGKIWSLIEYYDYSLKKAAEELGLSYSYVRRVASENHIHVRDKRYKTKKVTSRNVTFCNECGGQLRKVDSEIVCVNCGLATPVLDLASRLPFGTSYAHSSAMSFGRSLGSEISRGRFGLYQVLAVGGKEDLGLRARHTRIISQSIDCPQTLKLLNEGSTILRELGLYHGVENYDPQSHQLGEKYGANLRKVGAWLNLSKERVRNYHRLALVTLYITLNSFPSLTESLNGQPEKIGLLYSWREEDLTLVQRVLEIGKAEKKREVILWQGMGWLPPIRRMLGEAALRRRKLDP